MGVLSRLAVAGCLLAFFSLPAMASKEPAGAVRASGGALTIKHEKLRLPNGLEVILAEDHRLPLIAFNVWYHVGAKNEKPGLTGFAHLFEHLMFAGSGHIPRGEADKYVEAAGGTDSNGSTDFDRTNYFFTLPANQLALGLWLQSDMMGWMIDRIDSVSLANQQDVVRNERRQSTENRPHGIVEEALYQELFPPGHPYRAAIIGSHADIQSATLKDVKTFAKTHYRPNNATLVLVGDFDKAQAKVLVRKYFGSLRAGAPLPPVQVPQPVLTAEKRRLVADKVELSKLFLGWHTPAALQPGDAALDMAAYILAGGKAGRLYKSLVYERQIAQSVSASQSSQSLGSVFVIDAVARPGHSLEELQKAVDEELAKLAATPPSAEELQRGLNSVETHLYGALEKVMGIADLLNQYNQQAGDPGYLAKDLARYQALTPADISNAVARYLGTGRVVVMGVPGKQDLGPEVPTPPAPTAAAPRERESINGAESWRRRAPKAGDAPNILLPVPKRNLLDNGLTVLFVANPGVPMVSATLVTRAGQIDNPKPGLASFTAQMLQEGTAGRTALQFADDMAMLGASYSVGADQESTHLNLSALKQNFPAALNLMAESLQQPTFRDDEITRQKKDRLAALLHQEEEAGAAARITAAGALYGLDHPLGHNRLGDEEAISGTTADDLRDFWQRHYRPEQSVLVLSGDLKADAALDLARSTFGGWRARGEPDRRAPAAAHATQARLVLVDKPGAPQTALVALAAGPRATDPALPALSVANAALGGNFTSRLNQNLREVKGYTYGISSAFNPGRQMGSFTVHSDVRTEVTAPALAALVQEVKGFLAAPMGAEELARARNSQLLSLPGSFDTNDAIAGSYADAWAKDLPLDYISRLPRSLAAVNSRAAYNAIRQHLRLADLIFVAVGDRASIGPSLEALGIGPVEVRSPHGKLIH